MIEQQLEPCGCGKVPAALSIEHLISNYYLVKGTCCLTWSLPFVSDAMTRNGLMRTAVNHWNTAAPRPEPRTCQWTYNLQSGSWSTQCGQREFERTNEITHCYCGGKIQEA